MRQTKEKEKKEYYERNKREMGRKKSKLYYSSNKTCIFLHSCIYSSQN